MKPLQFNGKSYNSPEEWRSAKSAVGKDPQGQAPKPEGDDQTSAIHEHLKAMNAQDGKKHSHIVHHGDGTYTSHHVDEQGQTSGPHDHQNIEELKQHLDQFLNEESQEKGPGEDSWGE